MSRLLPFLHAILISVAYSQGATSQTSWFEGSGHFGPFPDWFASSVRIDYRSAEGFLSLAFDSCLIDSSLLSWSYLKAIDFDFDGDDDLLPLQKAMASSNGMRTVIQEQSGKNTSSQIRQELFTASIWLISSQMRT